MEKPKIETQTQSKAESKAKNPSKNRFASWLMANPELKNKTLPELKQAYQKFLELKNPELPEHTEAKWEVANQRYQDLLAVISENSANAEPSITKKIQRKAELFNSLGITEKFLAYADTKFTLREDILTLAQTKTSLTRADLENLENKYGLFLSRFGQTGPEYLSTVFANLNANLRGVERAKELGKKDFLQKELEFSLSETDLENITLGYRSEAIVLKTKSTATYRALYEQLTGASPDQSAGCAGQRYGFALIIIPETEDMDYATFDIVRHEGFHKEVDAGFEDPEDKYIVAESKQTKAKLNAMYAEYGDEDEDSPEEIDGNFVKAISTVGDLMEEEILAFNTQQEGYTFTERAFDHYFKNILDFDIDGALAKIERIREIELPEARAARIQLKEEFSQASQALTIFKEKGYSRVWISNALHTREINGKRLTRRDWLPLALSVPEREEVIQN